MLATVAVVTAGCGERPEGAGAPSPQGAEEAGQPLRVGLVPNQEPDKVKAEYAALGQYMERKLGRKVELTVPTGYPAVVEAMANNKLDVALFGGLTYVQARQRAKLSPLVTDINPETGSTKYTASVIVPADSPVRRIEDLRGKTFAFGSVSSTSGSLYPALMLRKAGIDYRSDLGRTTYTGGHDATAAAVASGKVDAGGLEGRILRRLVKKGTVDGAKIREIAVSDPIEGYPWVARDGLDPKLRDEIANLFLDLKDPRLLKLLNTKGYERVQASAYDSVERDATELGLLTRTK